MILKLFFLNRFRLGLTRVKSMREGRVYGDVHVSASDEARIG